MTTKSFLRTFYSWQPLRAKKCAKSASLRSKLALSPASPSRLEKGIFDVSKLSELAHFLSRFLKSQSLAEKCRSFGIPNQIFIKASKEFAIALQNDDLEQLQLSELLANFESNRTRSSLTRAF